MFQNHVIPDESSDARFASLTRVTPRVTALIRDSDASDASDANFPPFKVFEKIEGSSSSSSSSSSKKHENSRHSRHLRHLTALIRIYGSDATSNAKIVRVTCVTRGDEASVAGAIPF